MLTSRARPGCPTRVPPATGQPVEPPIAPHACTHAGAAGQRPRAQHVGTAATRALGLSTGGRSTHDACRGRSWIDACRADGPEWRRPPFGRGPPARPQALSVGPDDAVGVGRGTRDVRALHDAAPTGDQPPIRRHAAADGCRRGHDLRGLHRRKGARNRNGGAATGLTCVFFCVLRQSAVNTCPYYTSSEVSECQLYAYLLGMSASRNIKHYEEACPHPFSQVARNGSTSRTAGCLDRHLETHSSRCQCLARVRAFAPSPPTLA